jgi:hypothetical protein
MTQPDMGKRTSLPFFQDVEPPTQVRLACIDLLFAPSFGH